MEMGQHEGGCMSMTEKFLQEIQEAIDSQKLTTKSGLDFALIGAIVTAIVDMTAELKGIREILQRISTRVS